MDHNSQPFLKQQSLFPVKDSLHEAIQYVKDALPITSENEVHALLMLYHNTLIQEIEKHGNQTVQESRQGNRLLDR